MKGQTMKNWNDKKHFMIFKDDVKIDKRGIVYESGHTNDWFVDPVRPEEGFKFETVEKYSHAFIVVETREQALAEIKKIIHALKHGDGKRGDAFCPKCGYGYSFDYYDRNDGFYLSAIIEDFSEKIDCICGCKFKAKIVVKVTWEVEEI